jgi:polyhydroxybutyrate depolymerase
VFDWSSSLNLLAAGFFLAALGTSLGQTTVQFATRLSKGGFMSYCVACDNADLIAGIAVVGGFTFFDPSTHPPSQSASVLQIHCTADTTVPYADGLLGRLPLTALFPGAMATLQIWAGFKGCTGLQTDLKT